MDGLKFPTVGAELRSGYIMVELSMRLPRDGRMSVGDGRGAGFLGRLGLLGQAGRNAAVEKGELRPTKEARRDVRRAKRSEEKQNPRSSDLGFRFS